MLSKKPRKDPKEITVSLRITKRASEYLKLLAEANNMSQANVVEDLVNEEYENEEKLGVLDPSGSDAKKNHS